MAARYAVVITRIRDELPRSERVRPEAVLCRCEFDDREIALWTAREWTASRTGQERIKTIVSERHDDGPAGASRTGSSGRLRQPEPLTRPIRRH